MLYMYTLYIHIYEYVYNTAAWSLWEYPTAAPFGLESSREPQTVGTSEGALRHRRASMESPSSQLCFDDSGRIPPKPSELWQHNTYEIMKAICVCISSTVVRPGYKENCLRLGCVRDCTCTPEDM